MRIYIHQESFRFLCNNSEYAARLIIDGLVNVHFIKNLYRQIELCSTDISMEEISFIQSKLKNKNMYKNLNKLFFSIGYRDTLMGGMPKLKKFFSSTRESISASCFDDGYFTFATNVDSATTMYKDRESIKSLRKNIALNSSSSKVKGLILVKGSNLFFDANLSEKEQLLSCDYGIFFAKDKKRKSSNFSTLVNNCFQQTWDEFFDCSVMNLCIGQRIGQKKILIRNKVLSLLEFWDYEEEYI